MQNIKIRLNPKDEPSILKIERVILFVKQPEAKISIKQDFQISKSQSVFEIWVHYLQVSSNIRKVKLLYSNLVSDTTPSLIS